MGKYFNIKVNPISSVSLTNDNTSFVHFQLGSDNNDGSREAPFKTLNAAFNVSSRTKNNVVVSGIDTDNDYTIPGLTLYIIGEGIAKFKFIDTKLPEHIPFFFYNIKFISIGAVITARKQYTFHKCLVKPYAKSSEVYALIVRFYDSIIDVLAYNYGYWTNYNVNSCTIKEIEQVNPYQNNVLVLTIFNSILINRLSFSKYTQLLTFSNCIFLKTTKITYNDNEIPIEYTTGDDNLDFKNSLIKFKDTLEADKSYDFLRKEIDLLISSIESDNLKIYDDSNRTLFAKYADDGTILDYHLSNHPDNWAKSFNNGTYVGALPPAKSLSPLSVKNLDESTGNVLPDRATLVSTDANGTININTSSKDFWNQIEYPVQMIENGYGFNGFGNFNNSALYSGIYFGKKQKFTGDWKPDESVEMIPYATETEPSTILPKFSCPLSGDVSLLYHSGTDNVVRFSELKSLNITTDKDLTLYGDWGVTNADWEFHALTQLGGFSTRAVFLKYFKPIINVHRVKLL